MPIRLLLCGDLAAERLDGGEVDLREGRKRLDRVAEDIDRDLGADGERRLLEPLARLGPSAQAPVSFSPSLSTVRKPLDSAYARVYVAVLATSDTGAVPLNGAPVAPTAAACGSV